MRIVFTIFHTIQYVHPYSTDTQRFVYVGFMGIIAAAFSIFIGTLLEGFARSMLLLVGVRISSFPIVATATGIFSFDSVEILIELYFRPVITRDEGPPEVADSPFY